LTYLSSQLGDKTGKYNTQGEVFLTGPWCKKRGGAQGRGLIAA
jgi:hypothetical protein